jgi:hypothetical protein
MTVMAISIIARLLSGFLYFARRVAQALLESVNFEDIQLVSESLVWNCTRK